MREWARQQVAEKHRLEAAQASNAQEVARLKAENERIHAQAASDQAWADCLARIAANKSEILTNLTKIFEPLKQPMLAAYVPEGTVLGFEVDDVALHRINDVSPPKKLVITSHVLAWQNPDGSGGALRLILGQDFDTNEAVYAQVVDRRDYSREAFAQLGAPEQTIKAASAPVTQPSVWAPTNETVNSGYQAAIKLAAAAAGIAVVNMMSGN
jgi:hypothetical protein